MKYIVFIATALGVVLLYLLSHASASTAVSGHRYTVLLVLNIALAIFLTVLIVVQLWKLYRQLRSQVIGSRLTLRLLGAFALMALIPGTIVYAVSVNFLTRSIESWFNVKVEAALEGGLRLGQSTLDIMLGDLREKGENMALSLAFQRPTAHLSMLHDLREKSGVEDAVLLTPQGRILAFSSADSSGFLPELPSVSQLNQARNRTYGTIEPLLGKGLYLRVLTPVATGDMRDETRILQLLQPVPKALSGTAEAVQEVYQDYQELSFTRGALKDVFALTLTLVMMLAILSAVAFAFVLSRRLSAPLGLLAEGTRAIASGDYEKVLPEHGKDELGILVQSFNSMTRQLAEATRAAERNRARVEAARGRLQTILSHLSSGVLALDEHFQLRTWNPAAADILQINLEQAVGQSLSLLQQQSPALALLLEAVRTYFEAHQEGEWSQQLEVTGAQSKQVLLLRGTRLPKNTEGGYVVVFDDVTTLLQAQRDAAWGEVARRLAHEIKNPLTPIMLSAERLEHKLSSKLAGADAAMLQRATHTIVSQVGALKSMVDEFSEYARAPALNLSALDLNRLVREVLALYESHGIPIKAELQEDMPQVIGDATMLRQVLHNLLKNAQDALDGHLDPLICLKIGTENGMVRLAICDNGPGFPPGLIARAFEPYVTTKRHGTGLGLAIVKKIMEEHKGSIKIENQPHGGACVVLWLLELGGGMTARHLLVVDDEVGIRELLSEILRDEGYHVKLAENAAQARDLRLQERPDLVLLDIWMPDCDGISLLKEWGNGGLLTMPVVMMSGHGTIDTAVEATRIGAFDFLEKPIALQKLLKTVDAALKHADRQPRTSMNMLSLGKSAAIADLRKRLEGLAGLKIPVLLVGPKGTRADLFARFLQRTETPWLEISQLERLATGPVELLEQAREGIVFIPEIADIGKTERKGLLLLLDKAEKYNVRVVCATSHNLPELVQAGQFEDALLQALSAVLRIPPLDEHREDVPDLAKAMATLLAESGEVQYREFDVAALNALRNVCWPGNLAQLNSVVKNVMLTSLGEKIVLEDVSRVLEQFSVPEPAVVGAAPVLPIDLDLPLRDARDAFERFYFEHHVAKAGGNMSKVAEAVELERTHLYRKLKQLSLRTKQ